MTKTSTQLLRETMDAINSIAAPTTTQTVDEAPAAGAKRHDFYTTIYNVLPMTPEQEADEDGTEFPYPEEIGVGVDYRISGEDHPGSEYEPPSYADLEISGVYVNTTGQEISHLMDKSAMDELEEKCWAHAKGEAADNFDAPDDHQDVNPLYSPD